MSRSMLLVVALVACAPADDPLPVEQIGPPALGLAGSGPFVTGEVAHFFAWGMAPGTPVQIWGSLGTTGAPACPSNLPTCLDLLGSAARLVHTQANPQGAVLASLTVPRGLSTTDVQLQAILGDGSQRSPVVTTRIFAALGDEDADGVGNGDEILLHGTDPAQPDTDGGGIPDGEELAAGLDPLDATDDVVPLRPERWNLTMAFGYDGSTGAAVGFSVPGPLSVEPYLVLEGWQDRNGDGFSEPGELCYTTLERSGPLPPAPWLANQPGWLAGFDPTPMTVLQDDCSSLLDPVLYDGFIDAMLAADWSFALTPAADPFVEMTVESIIGAGTVMGAAWPGDIEAILGATPQTAWAVPIQTDASLQVQPGSDGLPLYGLRSDAIVGGVLQDGVYELRVNVDADVILALLMP